MALTASACSLLVLKPPHTRRILPAGSLRGGESIHRLGRFEFGRCRHRAATHRCEPALNRPTQHRRRARLASPIHRIADHITKQ